MIKRLSTLTCLNYVKYLLCQSMLILMLLNIQFMIYTLWFPLLTFLQKVLVSLPRQVKVLKIHCSNLHGIVSEVQAAQSSTKKTAPMF